MSKPKFLRSGTISIDADDNMTFNDYQGQYDDKLKELLEAEDYESILILKKEAIEKGVRT